MPDGKIGFFCPLIKDKCVKASCAWWIIEANKCSIHTLAESAECQAENLRDILNHM